MRRSRPSSAGFEPWDMGVLLNSSHQESCLRLILALAVATHERWLDDNRYLNMEYLRERNKEALQQAA